MESTGSFSQPSAKPQGTPPSVVEIKMRRSAAIRLALMLAASLAASGCATGDRERYFASQRLSIESTPGDGSTRVTAWPMPADVTLTLADPASMNEPR